MHTRPTWAEISLPNLLHNYAALRQLAQTASPAADILPVLKANAYGHSAQLCAPALAAANWLGVTSTEEAVSLRRHAPHQRILIMSGPFPGEAEAILAHRVTPIVWEIDHLDQLQTAAQRQNLPPQSVPVHLEIDTGMSRQGAQPGPHLEAVLDRFHPASTLHLEAIATHFASPEILDTRATENQIEAFREIIHACRRRDLHPALLHAGNSATLLRPQHLTALKSLATGIGAKLLLRPGLALYGYPPRFYPPRTQPSPINLDLKPVLAWKTRITSTRAIPPGQTAGYNETFRATRPTRLALVPVGYADGLNRLLSNRGHALVRGQKAPIAGRISMDQTILDITSIPAASTGDEVVLLGSQGSQTITAYDHADLIGTIPYEVLCNIAARVPRLPLD